MVQVVLWMIALVWLEILPLQSWAQEPQTEENPVCPGRPLAIQPTEKDVAGTGLSLEVLCILGDTWLARYDPPGPEESPDLLRRFLRQGPYEFGEMNAARYRAVMEEAVRRWPQSRYAHAGLARALVGDHVAPDAQPSAADLRRAADEFLIAAEIVFKQGRVPPIYIGNSLVQSLTELGDKQALDNYFKRVFELTPEGEGRCKHYVSYAEALGKLGDDRAETYFRKAVEVSPEGVEYTYEFYLGYLLDHGKAQAALDLLTPDSKAQRVLPEDLFRNMRCQALKQLGRERECLQAGGQTSPGTPSLP